MHQKAAIQYSSYNVNGWQYLELQILEKAGLTSLVNPFYNFSVHTRHHNNCRAEYGRNVASCIPYTATDCPLGIGETKRLLCYNLLVEYWSNLQHRMCGEYRVLCTLSLCSIHEVPWQICTPNLFSLRLEWQRGDGQVNGLHECLSKQNVCTCEFLTAGMRNWTHRILLNLTGEIYKYPQVLRTFNKLSVYNSVRTLWLYDDAVPVS